MGGGYHGCFGMYTPPRWINISLNGFGQAGWHICPAMRPFEASKPNKRGRRRMERKKEDGEEGAGETK